MSVERALERLRSRLSGYLRANEPLGRHTTFRIGGPAAIHVECDAVADLAWVLEVCAEEEVEWTVLGKGSNILAADAGYDGAVIVLGRDFKRHCLEEGHLRAGAGVALAALVQDAFGAGMTGLEFAVGIPGTLGGALVMNAGSRDEWIGSAVESVTLLEPGAGLVRLRGPEVRWGYRRTNLLGRGVIVESALRLEPGDEWRIRATMEAALNRRKRSQPLGLPNAGSIFTNPEGKSAGQLIESVGLKGKSVGGAQISDVHANFIVNTGGATAKDVLTLVRLARDTVKEHHGIELTPEIRFLGTFGTP
ncbi:MAG TPA: UDP-N-acetylmuramate dehydrogenase [Coriobacteriia bacterium]|nr:UDP-N-acetylmuramate dehydrogenase [Coriobacteriia bacterium]